MARFRLPSPPPLPLRVTRRRPASTRQLRRAAPAARSLLHPLHRGPPLRCLRERSRAHIPPVRRPGLPNDSKCAPLTARRIAPARLPLSLSRARLPPPHHPPPPPPPPVKGIESNKNPGTSLFLCFAEFDNAHQATVAMAGLQVSPPPPHERARPPAHPRPPPLPRLARTPGLPFRHPRRQVGDSDLVRQDEGAELRLAPARGRAAHTRQRAFGRRRLPRLLPARAFWRREGWRPRARVARRARALSGRPPPLLRPRRRPAREAQLRRQPARRPRAR